MAKALALHSGGLDSTLAIRVIQEQGIPVEAVHFVSVFDCGETEEKSCEASRRGAEQLNVPLHFENISEDLLQIVKNPAHGHGRNMNPCIDCHAMMVRHAARLMPQIGADFLITGEVLGERPMSQRREALGVVERDGAMEGLVLRPLSAKLLPPTIPEQRGWVDREKLHAINGRCRKPQLTLAKFYGIRKYPTPAGGCLLTDPLFAERVRDLLAHEPDCTVEDVKLLKVGRHFRIGDHVKAVVGRDEAENGQLAARARAGDVMMEAAEHSGPTTLVRGPANDEQLLLAASITLRYGKAMLQPRAALRLWAPGQAPESGRRLDAPPASDERLQPLRIAPPEEHGGRRDGE